MKSHQAGQGAGAHSLWGETERSRFVQSQKEKAVSVFYYQIRGSMEKCSWKHRKNNQTTKAINTSCSSGNLIRYKKKIIHLESGLALEQVPKELGNIYLWSKTCPSKFLRNLA